MARDEAYYEAEKKIEAARRVRKGAAIPQGDNVLRPNHHPTKGGHYGA